MHVAELTFAGLSAPTDEACDAVQGLLSTLYKNGQIVTRVWPITVEGAALRAVVLVAAVDALEARHYNRFASKALSELGELGLERPTVRWLGPDPTSVPECVCGDCRSALVLYTDYLSLEPPLRCLDCFQPLGLFRLPTNESGEHLGLLQWQADYQACDTLQMHTMTGERFGERQLGQLGSSLSRRGLELCASIARAVERPVFYYLHRARARSLRAELSRRCPSCGGPWRLGEPLHGRFDFRCDRCSLLSNVACSVRHRLPH